MTANKALEIADIFPGNIDKNELLIKLSAVRSVINQYSPKTIAAKKHLDRGVNFRYILIQDSILMLYDGIEGVKTNFYEIGKINIAFNSIYINVRGVIDNLAWILRYDLIKEKIDSKSISFTNKKFLNALERSGADISWISDYSNWFKDLSKMRDPIAHRLPLYIPPGIITDPEKIKEAQRLYSQPFTSIEEFRTRENEVSKLRTFVCAFIIDDAETGISHPIGVNSVLLEDLNFLVRFSNQILKTLDHNTK